MYRLSSCMRYLFHCKKWSRQSPHSFSTSTQTTLSGSQKEGNKRYTSRKRRERENKDDGGQTSIEKWQNQFIESRKERKGGSFSFDKKYACRGIKNIQDAKWPQWPSCRENHLETGNDGVSKMHGKQFVQHSCHRVEHLWHATSIIRGKR